MKIGYIVETQGPRLSVLASVFAYLILADDFFCASKANSWDIAALYGAIFDVSSITAAFLFSFLVFIKTTSSDFLSAFRREPAYELLLSSFKKSIGSSFLLCLITIVCLVTVPKPLSGLNFSFICLGVWFALVAYVISSTARSSYQFLAVLDAAYSKRFKT